MSAKVKTPCRYCGGDKEPGRGRKICVSCEETRKPLILQQQYQDRLERMRTRTEAKGAIGRQPSPEGQKWCARCEEHRPIDEFPIKKGKPGGYCRPCESIYMHEQVLRREYGITLDRYMEIFETQDGRCAICQSKPRKRRLSVDHDHQSGEIRGLLCTRCNHKLLGSAHDSAPMLRRAAAYLGAPPAQTGKPISGDDRDLIELLIGAWLTELEDTKAALGKSIGAIWIEPGPGQPRDGHVIMSAADYEALCEQAGRAA